MTHAVLLALIAPIADISSPILISKATTFYNTFYKTNRNWKSFKTNEIFFSFKLTFAHDWLDVVPCTYTKIMTSILEFTDCVYSRLEIKSIGMYINDKYTAEANIWRASFILIRLQVLFNLEEVDILHMKWNKKHTITTDYRPYMK